MIKQTCRCLVLCLLVGSAWSQNPTVSLRTLQLGEGNLPESWVVVKDAKEPVKLTWQTSQPTEPLQVLHDGQLKLFRYSLDPTGKAKADDVRAVKLPDGADEVLLLVWPNGDQSRYVAIKDQFLKADFNDWMAINASPNPVAIQAGSKSMPVKVEPGKSVIFKPDIEEGKGVEMIAMAPRKGELKTFLSTYWPAFAGQRTLILFYDDGDRMCAKRIGDRFVRKE